MTRTSRPPITRSSKPRPLLSPFASTGIKKSQTKRGQPKKRVEKSKKQQKENLTLENGLLNLDVKAAVVSEITQTNAKSSLLSLPAELRNLIWEYALDESYTFFHFSYYLDGKAPRMRARGARRDWLNLLRTCRQIYSETVLLPFQLSKFSFSRAWTSGLDFIHVELLPGQVAAMSQLTLSFSEEASEGSIRLPPLSGLKELVVILRDKFWKCEEHFEQEANVSRWIQETVSIPDDVKVKYLIHWAWRCPHPRT